MGASVCQINRLAKDTAEVLMALNTSLPAETNCVSVAGLTSKRLRRKAG